MPRKVQLFGGAFDVDLPEDAVDASAIRQIPDNQEVYLHPVTDQCIIVEILEHVAEADEQALRTHCNELVRMNADGAPIAADIGNIARPDTNTLAMMTADHHHCSCVLSAQCSQVISKYREKAANRVDIHVVLFRLPQYESDILMTFNDPVLVSPESSSHVQGELTCRWTVDAFANATRSLTLNDASIFGSPN